MRNNLAAGVGVDVKEGQRLNRSDQRHLIGHRRAKKLTSTIKMAYKSFIYGNAEWKEG